MRKTAIILTFVFFIGMVFNACKKDDKVAPDIPPESAFVMDMSDFSDNPDNYQKTTYDNYGFALLSVSVWHSLLTIRMAIPVASYIEAVQNHEAVYQSDQTWLWTYEFPVAGTSYTASLYGTVANDSADWKMYITKEGVYKDFLWYKGQSALDHSGGYWILYDSPLNNVEALEIVWTRQSEGVGSIRYTDIMQGGESNGAYIYYGNDNTDGDFSHYYDIYNAGRAQLTEIEWDNITKAGRVKDSVHFGDENWHCWDAAFQDSDCNIPAK